MRGGEAAVVGGVGRHGARPAIPRPDCLVYVIETYHVIPTQSRFF